MSYIQVRIQQLEVMRGGTKRQLCKFKGTCRNFVSGQQCPYSHDVCRSGDDCKNKENCMFYHPTSSSFSNGKKGNFSQPISEVQCKFGSNCNKLAEGKCLFKHVTNEVKQQKQRSMVSIPKKFQTDKSQMECKFGQRCNLFVMNKCPFKHNQSVIAAIKSNPIVKQQQKPPQNDRSQSFKDVFSNLCFGFIRNSGDHEECNKLHQYSTGKNIRKVFQIDNCKIIKSSIFQPHNQDQQPIYVILTQGRIVFGQLVNLAKQCSMEHINNSTLVFKRCIDKDIIIQNQLIEDFYLLFTKSSEYPRRDILIIKGRNKLYFCNISQGIMQQFVHNKNINGVAMLNNHVLITLSDKSKLFFSFDPNNNQFIEQACPIANNITSIKGSSKKYFGSECAIAVVDDKVACFINEKMMVQLVPFEENIKDSMIIQHQGSALALILTQKKIWTVSLLSFQKKLLLQGGFIDALSFSSFSLSAEILMIAINGWGILLYNINNCQTPVGILSLGDRSWNISTDDRGNLSVLSNEGSGYRSWWIFKIRR